MYCKEKKKTFLVVLADRIFQPTANQVGTV